MLSNFDDCFLEVRIARLGPTDSRHGDLSTRRDITDIVDSAPVVVCLGEAGRSAGAEVRGPAEGTDLKVEAPPVTN